MQRDSNAPHHQDTKLTPDSGCVFPTAPAIAGMHDILAAGPICAASLLPLSLSLLPPPPEISLDAKTTKICCLLSVSPCSWVSDSVLISASRRKWHRTRP